jgi:heme a synthase
MDLDDAAPQPPGRQSVGTAARRLVFVRRTALVCALLVALITSLSANIRLSKAGLSCPDWPACYGQGLRDLQQGRPAVTGEDVATAAVRLAHRIVASTALLLVLAMCAACLTVRPIAWNEARAALALLALALFLAVLGRWSSDARVPAVAIGNLLGGFTMLALCWRLAYVPRAVSAPRLRQLAWLATLLVAAQVALGGLLSASYAALSCTTGLADCLAAARSVPVGALDPWREPLFTPTPAPVNPAGALALVVHALVGAGASLVVAVLGIAALRAGRRAAAALLLGAVVLEPLLGAAMSAQGPTLLLALAHNLAAALLLATAFELTRGARGDEAPQSTATAMRTTMGADRRSR